MYIEINKRHKSNGKRFLTVCDYGYFLPRGKWEAVAINFLKWTIFIYRKRQYRKEWPVACG
jgi:hypothetical protein